MPKYVGHQGYSKSGLPTDDDKPMFDGSITISPDISVSFIGSIPIIVGWYTVNIQLGCPFESHIISRNQALLDISLKFNPHVWCLETCFLSKSHRLSRRLHQNPNPTRYVFPYVPWFSYIFQRFLFSVYDVPIMFQHFDVLQSCFCWTTIFFLLFHRLQPPQS